jgi:hypothetical protein
MTDERKNLPSFLKPYTPNTPGIFDMPAAEYHDEKKGLSRSMAIEIVDRSAEHMRYDSDHPEEPTKFMEFGTLVHCSTLEPKTLSEQYYVRPEFYPSEEKKGVKVDKPWHNGATFCKEWNASHADRTIISAKEEEMVHGCTAKIRSHPLIASMLKVGKVEQSCFAQCPTTGIWLRCRTDLMAIATDGRLFVLDIKKTQNATRRKFTRTVRDNRYDFQEAWYRHVMRLLNMEVAGFLFCAVEEQPPHGLGVFQIAPEKVERQYEKVQLAIDTYAQSREQGRWPGYTEEIQTVDWREAV